MTLAEATRLLGLLPEEAKSVRSIRAAFARCAKAVHPDRADPALMKEGLGYELKALQCARDTLLAAIAHEKNTCVLCSGRGRVRVGMGWRQCGACDGMGELK